MNIWKCFLCEENMVLRNHLKYFCVNCNSSTIYCLKCNKNLEILLLSAYFKCVTCKRLSRTSKIETVNANNKEIYENLLNTQSEQELFRQYFNLKDKITAHKIIDHDVSTSSQTSSCWIYDNKNKKSKGNFIVLSTHPEQIINDSKKLMTDSNINFHNNPWTNRNNENALNNNCEINIFPDQRIYFEKKDNNNSTNSINLRPNNILIRPKSMLRQIVEDTTSKVILNSGNYQLLPNFHNMIYQSPTNNSSLKLESLKFSSNNISNTNIIKSPYVSKFS